MLTVVACVLPLSNQVMLCSMPIVFVHIAPDPCVWHCNDFLCQVALPDRESCASAGPRSQAPQKGKLAPFVIDTRVRLLQQKPCFLSRNIPKSLSVLSNSVCFRTALSDVRASPADRVRVSSDRAAGSVQKRPRAPFYISQALFSSQALRFGVFS